MEPNDDRTDWVQRSGNARIDDDHGRLLSRLRKVLQLTNSPNEKESVSAASKLQELLTEHNLSMADLEARGQSSPGMREQPHDLGKAGFKWKLDLADGIAEFYYCAPIVNRTTKSVAFVGRPDNVEALTMLYAWVIEQVKTIARDERRAHFDRTDEHIDPLRWQIGFGEGAVERLIVRLREMKCRQEEDATRNDRGDITALVIHRQAEVSDYLEEKFGYRLDGKMTKKQRESEERWAKYLKDYNDRMAKKEAMRIECEDSGDMEPFYDEYPEEHPDEVARREKRHEELDRIARKKARRSRSTGFTMGRERKVDEAKDSQSRTARVAGREAAKKVNLQPFLDGRIDRKKVSNG